MRETVRAMLDQVTQLSGSVVPQHHVAVRYSDLDEPAPRLHGWSAGLSNAIPRWTSLRSMPR